MGHRSISLSAVKSAAALLLMVYLNGNKCRAKSNTLKESSTLIPHIWRCIPGSVKSSLLKRYCLQLLNKYVTTQQIISMCALWLDQPIPSGLNSK